MSTPTTEATIRARTAARGGSISTEEIKARIEAMFADDRPRSRPTSR